MKNDIRLKLEKLFEKWNGSVAEPVSEQEIINKENLLEENLPNDYRDFIKKYGGAVINGNSIFGLRKPTLMFDEPSNFDEQSIIFRKELPKEYSKIVVISVDAFGNPTGFLPPSEKIFTYDFDFGGQYELAENFNEYLENLLNK